MTDIEHLSKANPCPFCGSADLSLWWGSVTCDDCAAQGPFEAHFNGKDYAEEQRLKALAVTRWNARALPNQGAA